ncbi:ABC transporter ATP-binding protein [Rhizobium leguminosarum]|uniref:ABC transporter ATP-binding protein n=2 Tax=Rhizobium leguminosarum TaxID=384 RepID=UPI00103B845F|nr:ABC transporter ATP-binding protein [Rhizobium leguminosarum]NKK46895.1 ATP-binding cassette domain-containing protein [Rhizobium leguminosarum bv. viciae]TBZ40464.1 ABC transporter ATP-binding protein [Rhizobium leguminosarum bv. viciae]TCA06440.1 ABC transporter ATP-binding protein [Rhizobium leguminosarum bv. viciae]TCA19648.1 ABC transporter ATP-binding protein [Rhizobium leguminosarum bv. viciae]
MPNLVSVRDLHKSFGGLHVLRGMTLDIPEGEMRVLLGPNGCGKSTFLKTLIGLHRPTSGEIRLAGTRIDRLHPHEIARMGVSTKLQIPSVFKELSVYQNLRIAVQRQTKHDGRVQARVIQDTIEMIGLNAFSESRAGSLSHGHQQWLEIGMAIASEPRILLLDEPTAGMTPEETQQTVRIVSKLNKTRGMSVVIVEHDMAFVSELNAPILVLNQGTIFFEGSLQEVRSNEGVKEIYFGSRA